MAVMCLICLIFFAENSRKVNLNIDLTFGKQPATQFKILVFLMLIEDFFGDNCFFRLFWVLDLLCEFYTVRNENSC